MRSQLDVFHLAIPVHDLDAAEEFYVRQLGTKLARRYPDRITLDFFGDQLVCHLSGDEPDTSVRPSLYPRHFGVTFFAEVTVRFDGMAEAHRTFVLRDPSDNLIEFKHYDDPRMMY
jgi:extradiol dioxygenase family protein